MKHYKEHVKIVNTLLEEYIETNIKDDEIKEMIKHSIHGGKRLRSIIPLIIRNQLNPTIPIEKFSLSIEDLIW